MEPFPEAQKILLDDMFYLPANAKVEVPPEILWFLKQSPTLRFEDTEHIPLDVVPRRMTVRSIPIYAEVEQLLALVLDQNFVPVTDDRDVFVGIVRRRAILSFFEDKLMSALRDGTP